jgi:hypothetical protein
VALQRVLSWRRGGKRISRDVAGGRGAQKGTERATTNRKRCRGSGRAARFRHA